MADRAALVEQARRAVSVVSAVARAPRELRTRARGLALRTAVRMRAQVLAELPVSQVRKRLPSGTRFPAGVVEQFASVAELAEASVVELCAVRGVGVASAPTILDAAREVSEQVSGQVTVRLDDPHTDMSELVGVLAAIRYADRVVPDRHAELLAWARRARGLVTVAARATSRRWMVFASRARRREARAAVVELAGMMADPRTVELVRWAKRHRSGVRPGRWSGERGRWEYERDPAGFASLLACVGGSVCAGHPEAAGGFLSEELRRQVADMKVDTSLMKATLLGYQVFGVQYILNRKRTILGDEMGLGKTLQALAAAAHLMSARPRARVLVVCPASVLWNWMAEIARHTRLRGLVGHGPDRDGAVFRWRRTGGVLVTTFGTVDRLRLPDMALVIVDEAHYAKNEHTLRSQAVQEVTRRSELAVYLTGTPMENRVSEFANLVSFLDNGVDVSRLADGGRVVAKQFRHKVGSVYLRRNQGDVLHDLPTMFSKVEWIKLTDADRHAHDTATNPMARRQATYGQAKRARLAELVDQAGAEDRKVIVFSYFRSVLDQIQADLGDVVVGQITGDVTPKNRQALVDEYSARRGTAVLLAQIGAGGTGLNIQAASVVIMVEPQWTSSIEEQAIARALRKGQTRSVLVRRLVAIDSYDMHVRAVQLGKAAEFEEYARPSEAKWLSDQARDTNPVPD